MVVVTVVAATAVSFRKSSVERTSGKNKQQWKSEGMYI